MKKTFKTRIVPLFGIIAIVAVIGFGIVSCSDEGGDPPPPPEVATYPLINLTATKWENADGSAEQWTSGNQIKLSDFTTVKPKVGDVLKFKISGNASEQIKNCEIIIMQMQGDNYDTFRWLGSSSVLESPLPNPFNDFIVESPIWVVPLSNVAIYVEINNTLWQKNSSGEYTHNSGQTLPPGTQNGDVMATISNFSISLVVDPPEEESGGGSAPIFLPRDGYLHSTYNYRIYCTLLPNGNQLQNAGVFTLQELNTEEYTWGDEIEGTYNFTFNTNTGKIGEISFVSNGGSFTFTATLSDNGQFLSVYGITGEKEYLNGTWYRY